MTMSDEGTQTTTEKLFEVVDGLDVESLRRELKNYILHSNTLGSAIQSQWKIKVATLEAEIVRLKEQEEDFRAEAKEEGCRDD